MASTRSSSPCRSSSSLAGSPPPFSGAKARQAPSHLCSSTSLWRSAFLLVSAPAAPRVPCVACPTAWVHGCLGASAPCRVCPRRRASVRRPRRLRHATYSPLAWRLAWFSLGQHADLKPIFWFGIIVQDRAGMMTPLRVVPGARTAPWRVGGTDGFFCHAVWKVLRAKRVPTRGHGSSIVVTLSD